MSDDQQPSFFRGLPPHGDQGGTVTVVGEDVVAENDLDSEVPETVVAPSRGTPKNAGSGSLSFLRKSERKEDDSSAPDPTPTSGGRNKLALVAFIGSIFVAPVGIICGHRALKQIKRTGQNGRRFALAGAIIGYVGLVAWAAVLTTLLIVGGADSAQSSAALQASVAADNATETAKNEAIIAEGGGAVEGHKVSAELCAALDAFVATEDDAVTAQVSPEMLAATEALAAVESSNQKAYQGYLGLLKDPASVESIADAQALSADFSKATQIDVATCAVGL